MKVAAGATADQKKKTDDTIKASVDRHDELRQFILDNKLAEDINEAQQFIERLTADDIDVHTVEHMRGMTANDFRSAGFSLRLAKAFALAVKNN